MPVTHAIPDLAAEWLEVDGLGGFASGTVGGSLTRRYHGLLLVATHPPVGRVMLVNGLDVWVETPAGTFPISTQRYLPDVTWPHGCEHLSSFVGDPWPTWEFALTEEITVRQELFVPRGVAGVCIRWGLLGPPTGVCLHVKPFLSGRDYHALHSENREFNFDSENSSPGRVRWQPYAGLPAIVAETNAVFQPHPEWYRRFFYQQERDRGLDCSEELACPGEFHFDLSGEDAVLLLAADKPFSEAANQAGRDAVDVASVVTQRERQRRAGLSEIDRAASAYFVQRGAGQTIIAGYPWFTDWGRDTFIAVRGLSLVKDGLRVAEGVLTAWAAVISQGMLPNRFSDREGEAEFNAVDASLWYVIAVHDFLTDYGQQSYSLSESTNSDLRNAVESILDGYSRGTRHGIRLDEDGLVAAGVPGLQLTWMDAKVNDWVVTPRTGKPVEVQALWLNALSVGAQYNSRWQALRDRAHAAFVSEFWNEDRGCLFDLVDVNHRAGEKDDAVRPNQIFSVGGLPWQLLPLQMAQKVVAEVEAALLTPMGLRSLSTDHPSYRGRYEGGVVDRDGAYHQGTVWPWLLGPFVEGWVRIRGSTPAAKAEAARRFLTPLEEHLPTAGLGHISEIADGDPPHTPRGCPFQAWSMGEYLRLKRKVLAECAPPPSGGQES